MAKRYPAHIRQAGVYATTAPDPHVVLGSAESGYLTLSAQQASGKVSDGDTLDVYFFKTSDPSAWASYENSSYDHSNGWIDLSAATAAGNAGTISNSDNVTLIVGIGQTTLESFIEGE